MCVFGYIISIFIYLTNFLSRETIMSNLTRFWQMLAPLLVAENNNYICLFVYTSVYKQRLSILLDNRNVSRETFLRKVLRLPNFY